MIFSLDHSVVKYSAFDNYGEGFTTLGGVCSHDLYFWIGNSLAL